MQIHILFSLAKTLCNELGHFIFSSLQALIQSSTCKNYNSSRNLQMGITAIILLKCTPSPLKALIQCKLHLSRGSLVQGQKSLFLKVFSQDEVSRERVLVCKRSKNTTIKNNFPGPWKLWRGKVVFRLVSYSNDPTERKLVITWGAMAGLAFSVPSVWITCKKPIVLF